MSTFSFLKILFHPERAYNLPLTMVGELRVNRDSELDEKEKFCWLPSRNLASILTVPKSDRWSSYQTGKDIGKQTYICSFRIKLEAMAIFFFFHFLFLLFTYLFIYLFIYLLIYLFIYSFIHSFCHRLPIIRSIYTLVGKL